MHNLKVKNYVLFRGLSEDIRLEESPSDGSEVLFQKGKGETRIYRSFCNKKPGSCNIKRLLLIKENQTSQVKEFCTFPYTERCKSLCSLKSLL